MHNTTDHDIEKYTRLFVSLSLRPCVINDDHPMNSKSILRGRFFSNLQGGSQKCLNCVKWYLKNSKMAYLLTLKSIFTKFILEVSTFNIDLEKKLALRRSYLCISYKLRNVCMPNTSHSHIAYMSGGQTVWPYIQRKNCIRKYTRVHS